VIETMADLTEARVAVSAAHATGLPVVACMVFESGKNKDRTLMGATVEQAVNVLVEAGADVVGANCGQGIAGFLGICTRMRASTRLPIWIKANAGLPELVNRQAVYRTTPERFAGFIPGLISSGANFVGGCCGTNPAFVMAVREKLRVQNAE
jgi:methionine synthase I (cobalamin-dependent)